MGCCSRFVRVILSAFSFLIKRFHRPLAFDDGPVEVSADRPVRHLIVTADDFGANPSINAGVREAVRTGAVDSVAVMVTFPGALEEIRNLRAEYPGVEMGIHLSITAGSPVSPPGTIPSLLSGDQFHTVEKLTARLAEVDLPELERELRAQINTLKQADISIAYLSNHHGVIGLYPPFVVVMFNLAAEYGLAVRSTVPASLAFPGFPNGKTHLRVRDIAIQVFGERPLFAFKMLSFLRLNVMRESQFRMNRMGIAHPDFVVDSLWGEPTPSNLLDVLRALPPGTSELVIHVGLHEQPAQESHGIDGNYFLIREYELFLVTSPMFSRWLELQRIHRVTYSSLCRNA